MKYNHSFNLHTETEVTGELFNNETLEIIRVRYEFAASYMLDMDVLEIGCGSGIGLDYFSQVSSTLIGGEYSQENIELCRTLHGAEYSIVRMDAHKVPFSDESFDIVVALAMVYYLNIEIFLSEVKRILRPGGKLIFCTSNKNVPGFVSSPHTTKYYSIIELNGLLSKNEFYPFFFGAFKSTGGSLLLSRLRGYIKKRIKFLVFLMRGGDGIWNYWRNKSLGKKYPLPKKISMLPASTQKPTLLNSSKNDYIHRVIYVAAKKMKD